MIPVKNATIFMGSINRSYYRHCLEAGVRIFERGGNFIHSKTFVTDDYLSSIGSANIDNRSFNLNYEVNTYIYDEETALRNKEIFLEDLTLCKEITLDEFKAVPWYRRFWQKLLGLFSSIA
jgi:cardiolipin synthase